MKRKQPLLVLLFAIACSFWLAFTCSPDWTLLAGRAALASAMLAMPQGSTAILERRFADKLYPPPSQEEKEVAPYVRPWEEEEPVKSEPSAEEPDPVSEDGPVKSKNAGPPAVQETDVPEEFQGTLLQENMSGQGGKFLSYGKGLLRNSTETPDDEVLSILDQGLNIQLEETEDPQILIVHTHATESYEPFDSATFDVRNSWRDTDNQVNMTAVGDALEKKLQEAGIGVVHDKTQHDYPSYNGAYERSAATIRKYLEKYP